MIVVVLCSAYVVSHFYRSSVGVIGPDLMRGMGLSPEALGTLAGTFFLVFGISQIPVGILLDRFGPRLVNSSLFVVAAIGALIFAAAPDAGTLTLGRAVMGLGCASALIGSLVVYSRWFSPRQFSTLAGLTLGLGGLGGLVATTPLALAAEYFGWRGAFVGAAGVTLLVALMVWLGIRDAPPGQTFHEGGHRESLADTLKGVGTVLANRSLYLVMPLNAVAYASVMAILALWGAPYLIDVHGLDAVIAADILGAMMIAMMVGSIGYGWLGKRLGNFRPAVLFGAGSVIAIYGALALAPKLDVAVLAILFCLLGLIGGYSVLLLSHVRGLFPDRMVGRGLTAANLFNFGGVGIVQAVSGWIVGIWPAAADGTRPAEAYQALFWFLVAIVVAAASVYAFARLAQPMDSSKIAK
jgi:sugar phosphate permease